jgi:hypothetical protein
MEEQWFFERRAEAAGGSGDPSWADGRKGDPPERVRRRKKPRGAICSPRTSTEPRCMVEVEGRSGVRADERDRDHDVGGRSRPTDCRDRWNYPSTLRQAGRSSGEDVHLAPRTAAVPAGENRDNNKGMMGEALFRSPHLHRSTERDG